MTAAQQRVITAAAFLACAVFACNYPQAPSSTPDNSGTPGAQTLAALQTGDALTQVAAYTATTPASLPSGSIPAVTSASSLSAAVTRDALCWLGPGQQYEVVSAIHTGIRVELMGRGTVPGWYILRNPIYHDPCWIAEANLQVDPSVDVSSLPLFSPPATPTPTATKTPASSETPAPSPTVSGTP